ncbi:MAG TPA: hypothetical protein VI653_14650 [Steroidobacteraceae bacterium]
MTHADLPTRFGSEFNDFLFSSIGEDRNGLMLSVASMLARLDLDPWHEAASFAGLPVAAATQKLTSLIAALPDQAFKKFDPAALAAGLITLLPRQRPAHRAIPTRPLSISGRTLTPRKMVSIVLLVLFMGFLAAQFFPSSREPPPPGAAHHTRAPSTDLQGTPPTSQ